MKPHSEVVWTLFVGTDLKRTLINLIGLGDLFSCRHLPGTLLTSHLQRPVGKWVGTTTRGFYRAGLSAGIALFLPGKSQSYFL